LNKKERENASIDLRKKEKLKEKLKKEPKVDFLASASLWRKERQLKARGHWWRQTTAVR
jgi:hypothetical protein